MNNKPITIIGRTITMCPHCWPKDTLRKSYPELSQFDISHKTCNEHFSVMQNSMLYFMEILPSRRVQLELSK